MTNKKIKTVIPEAKETVKTDVNSVVTNVINEHTVTSKNG